MATKARPKTYRVNLTDEEIDAIIAAAALHECEYEDEPGQARERQALSRVVGKAIQARDGWI